MGQVETASRVIDIRVARKLAPGVGRWGGVSVSLSLSLWATS